MRTTNCFEEFERSGMEKSMKKEYFAACTHPMLISIPATNNSIVFELIHVDLYLNSQTVQVGYALLAYAVYRGVSQPDDSSAQWWAEKVR